MSNHYHAVVHDPHGRLPAFLEQLHKMLAKALNARWSRWENLWASEETCVTYLPTPQDIFEKVVYTLANPVVEHLVERLADWPGSSSFRYLARLGTRTRHPRPKAFFRGGGRMPDAVELGIVLPPQSQVADDLTDPAAAWANRVLDAVAERERRAREERMRTGLRVRGRKAVRRVSAEESPKTREPRRTLRPALACKDPKRRAAELANLVAFRASYAAARRRFAAGDRGVVFPAGTYRLRAWGVTCGPPLVVQV
jgi:hypothetical protein